MTKPRFFSQTNSLAMKHKANRFVGAFFRYVLLIGLSFIILYPFIARISTMFMSEMDLVDPTVRYIPRNPTLDNIKYIFTNSDFGPAFLHTFLLSLISAVLTTAVACCVGYGLAKFRLKGGTVVAVLVVFSILIPPQSILIPMYSYFRFFDIFGIFQAILGQPLTLTDTYWPIVWLSATGFSFRAGLFILVVWQFMRGVPDELLEAAEVDGANKFQTFFHIVLPQLRNIMTYAFVTSIIGGLQLFDLPFTFAGATGGPSKSVLTMVMYMYNIAFQNYDYGYGSAISYGLFVIIIVFSLIFMKYTAGKERNF